MEFVKKGARKVLGTISPKLLASLLNHKAEGHYIDWKNPKSLNEKILWLSLNTDTTKWTRLADKYEVRSWLKEMGCEDMLPKLYGVWDKAEDIDFDKLPEKFILKTNHGSGTNIVVKNKAELNIEEARKQLNDWLKLKFGWPYEPHYLRIKPRIIAEELLDATKQPIASTSLIDYKCFCMNGKVELIWACYNRSKEGVKVDTHYPDWSYHPELSVFTAYYQDGENKLPPPVNLQSMLEVSAKLSKEFPEVRIDYYEVDGKLYFGEMTFTSATGIMDFFTHDCLVWLGDKVVLPK
ncbi:TupA-like ATPgrasp [Xylanibacter ruminicola]|uniref:TupA-like ATPgrasp n=1 Tax=Xylanibacter ruminicola TaxID=839 RepID=A0A1M7JHM9_XYLRU|nr:ATP-grasp fold amidoligase family protein [Xylanibacter ruminicola]SFC82574.1 TupA-like ATPgrasp [Xylanibacter ruminicola]SHM52468.1 TupA-like ATPgrasp [Xylanibacter ruminicola]